MVRKAPAEVVGKAEAAARLAAHHGFALPEVRPGDAQEDSERRTAGRRSSQPKRGEIKAQIIERDGKILMVKDCPIHGHFEDVMAIDPRSSSTSKKVFPGRDIRAHADKGSTTTVLPP
jgi:hypothetical protein